MRLNKSVTLLSYISSHKYVIISVCGWLKLLFYFTDLAMDYSWYDLVWIRIGIDIGGGVSQPVHE